MNRSQTLESIRAYLLARRETLRHYIAGELSNLGTDTDEESLDDEAYFIMAASESKEIELIQSALDRFRDGSYGQCESCEKDIPVERLEALPCASLCIDCQKAAEAQPRLYFDASADTETVNEASS